MVSLVVGWVRIKSRTVGAISYGSERVESARVVSKEL